MPTLVPCTERFSSERVSAKACSHEFFKAAFAGRFGQFLHEPAAACATHPVSPESFRGCKCLRSVSNFVASKMQFDRSMKSYIHDAVRRLLELHALEERLATFKRSRKNTSPESFRG
jgi:hypothetical protein